MFLRRIVARVEKRQKMAMHAFQEFWESRRKAVAQENNEGGQSRLAHGERMGLAVGDHLQPVFDPASSW